MGDGNNINMKNNPAFSFIFLHNSLKGGVIYSSHVILADLVHYTSTGEGSILTVDQRTGSLLWTLEMDSPLVAMYFLGLDGECGGALSVFLLYLSSESLDIFAFSPCVIESFIHFLLFSLTCFSSVLFCLTFWCFCHLAFYINFILYILPLQVRY